MRKLLDIGNRYAKESTWKDFALVKFCLFAMGLAAGTQVPDKYKKAAVGVAAGVFAVTYVPLMTKVFRIAWRCQLAQTFHPLWLVEKSDGLQKSALAQILHPPTAMRRIRWYGKASLCTNSPSTYGYATNPMVWKSFLVLKLSIHLQLYQ